MLFEDGWGLVRASNTQPALVLRFEAMSEKSFSKLEFSAVCIRTYTPNNLNGLQSEHYSGNRYKGSFGRSRTRREGNNGKGTIKNADSY